jgi:chromosomal replication initiation ATPase DnaA
MAWHALLEAVESRATFPRSEIDTWLRPARLAGRDGDALLIAAPNAVARDRLDARMLPQLRAVAAATFGAQIALRVVVG